MSSAMRCLYAVEREEELRTYRAIAKHFQPRLEAYCRFLAEEYAVRELLESRYGGHSLEDFGASTYEGITPVYSSSIGAASWRWMRWSGGSAA